MKTEPLRGTTRAVALPPNCKKSTPGPWCSSCGSDGPLRTPAPAGSSRPGSAPTDRDRRGSSGGGSVGAPLLKSRGSCARRTPARRPSPATPSAAPSRPRWPSKGRRPLLEGPAEQATPGMRLSATATPCRYLDHAVDLHDSGGSGGSGPWEGEGCGGGRSRYMRAVRYKNHGPELGCSDVADVAAPGEGGEDARSPSGREFPRGQAPEGHPPEGRSSLPFPPKRNQLHSHSGRLRHPLPTALRRGFTARTCAPPCLPDP